uniref:Uncharacterized protein n=1 Tax=Timema tahoe TaxID=61484 RepID=A0A7R9FNT1_9NEOP|nr:unnamed protein product [Timema tahoe]
MQGFGLADVYEISRADSGPDPPSPFSRGVQCISLSEAVVQRGVRDSACARVCSQTLPRSATPGGQLQGVTRSYTSQPIKTSSPTPNNDAASTPNSDQQ